MSRIGVAERDPAPGLERLTPLLRSTFAAACAERLLPAYSAYAERTGGGAPRQLAIALDRLWRDLEGEPMSPGEAQENFDRCLSLIPDDDEEEWVPEQAAAEDAAAALAYAVRARQDGDIQDAARAGRRVFAAIDDYVIRTEDMDISQPGVVERVLAHPLVTAELARQRRDLAELQAVRADGEAREVIARLRDRAREEARILFG